MTKRRGLIVILSCGGAGRGLRAHCPSLDAPSARKGSCSLLVPGLCPPLICHPMAGVCVLSPPPPTIPAFVKGH